MSYIKESTPQLHNDTFRRKKIFNNSLSTQNSTKANWKSLHSENFQNYYLKSGQLESFFKIRVK